MIAPDASGAAPQEMSGARQYAKHDLVADDMAVHDEVTSEDVAKRKSNKRKMTCTVVFRLTPEEHARLETRSRRSGYKTVNEWARDNALRATGHSEINDRTLRRLMGQLGEIGGRLEAVATAKSGPQAPEMQTEPRETITIMRKVMHKIAEILQ